ncbi:helix-turn-helix domain-containing protein [Mesorhizobium sp. M0317]|uniref:helix-turn-helix domain-containing protein n=1 Tax=Mesorhizobium sp. M0317 TaxID=2956935 RepID=UPI00333C46F8
MPYDGPRHNELARFLRERRDRLPRIDGANGRRRAPGLRREEVAAEAGISTTWYTWLEQGREVNASPQVLRSLARVLKLSRSEQAYLYQLARPDLDWRNRLGEQGLPSAPLLSLLDGLAPHPAYVVNRYWQVVACNHRRRCCLGISRRMMSGPAACSPGCFSTWNGGSALSTGRRFRARRRRSSGLPLLP